MLTSITDEHFRGFTRLPVIGRARGAAQWVSAFALASGEPVYGLGEKFGPLNKRGQIVHSHVDGRAGRQYRAVVQERAVLLESVRGQERVGHFRQHARSRHARRRPS